MGADHSSGLDRPGIEAPAAVAAQQVTASLPCLGSVSGKTWLYPCVAESVSLRTEVLRYSLGGPDMLLW